MAPNKIALVLGFLLAIPKLFLPARKGHSELQPEREGSRSAGHELSDVSSKGIFKTGLMMLIGGLIMHISLVSLFIVLRHQSKIERASKTDSRLFTPGTLPPQPRLQKDPQRDLQAYFAKEKKHLSTYGWMNRMKKQVRIPIERAIDLLVERTVKKNEST